VSPPVTIVDYGVGNLFSVRSALEHCGADATLSSDPETIASAERLLLPGVGAFGEAMDDMRSRGLEDGVLRFAATGRPLLGICLGMQLLMERSEEFGSHEGLGLVPGEVVAIAPTAADGQAHRLPHIGWAGLRRPSTRAWSGTILEGVPDGAWFYFVHGFAAQPAHAGDRLADCDYNGRMLCAVLTHGNVMGCQFHPEKSGAPGLGVLRRFLSI
jgi:imidazole glycerol-phosphate synthase subunit HisH